VQGAQLTVRPALAADRDAAEPPDRDEADPLDQTDEFPADELPQDADELPARADLEEEDLGDLPD
jgi:hypothetical protein